MNNIQEIFDAYLQTMPSAEKIKSATSMMIHLGKALNVTTQEEITNEYYDEMLVDKNENVRQYALKSLEFSGLIKPKSVMPFIEKHIHSDEEDLVTTAEYLAAKILCSEKNKIIIERINSWYKKGERDIISTIMNRVHYLMQNDMCDENVLNKDTIINWIKKDCPDLVSKISKIFKSN
jgi:hypothetical protein